MADDHLEDRIALQELKASYYRYVDTKQWAALRQLLAEDLLFYRDSGPSQPATEPLATSADELVEFVSANLENAVTIHQLHMPELQFTDENNATGVWALYDWLDRPGSDMGSASTAYPACFQGFGHLHERYVKGDDGRWRVAEVHLTRLRLDPVPPSGMTIRPTTPWKRPR